MEPLRAIFGLTRAELLVLSHLTQGEAPKDIGRKMDMSIHTVRAHLRAICMRMGGLPPEGDPVSMLVHGRA